MEDIKSNVAKNITELRILNNMTQMELAEKLNYSDKTISKWETGEIIPSLENLIKLCDIYNVTLDEITHPIPQEKLGGKKHKSFEKQNKIIITLLAILTVWITATAIFVYGQIIANVSLWVIFIWAIPVSCIVTIVFNSLWGKRIYGFITISILLWSLITAFYLQFLSYNLFAMYFVGIPLQVAIFLWSGLKKRN